MAIFPILFAKLAYPTPREGTMVDTLVVDHQPESGDGEDSFAACQELVPPKRRKPKPKPKSES